MQARRSSPLLLLSLLVGPVLAHAVEPGPAEAARAMVESEKKFYQTGQEKGTRAAFLAFLADDGIVFAPEPTNGKEAWTKRPENGLDLIWEPTFASIARSADLGYTTGPAKWKPSKKEKKPTGYGHFVSIWKKQEDGSWKVALDLGIEHPPPTGKPESLRLVVPEDDSKERPDPYTRRSALLETHRKFMEAAKTDSSTATLNVAADDIRLYRDGHFPSIGKGDAQALLSPKESKVTFDPIAGGKSASVDLAYVYGKYFLTRGETTEEGYYFHIWQLDAAGGWKLVLDWQKARPPANQPAK